MCARDQCSIFSMVHPDCGLLLELHALTLVARSYALLSMVMELGGCRHTGSPSFHGVLPSPVRIIIIIITFTLRLVVYSFPLIQLSVRNKSTVTAL